MSIHSVHLRKRMDKVAPRKVLLPFRITHIHKFALEPTQAHIRACPIVISGGTLQRSIPSRKTKLNEDKLSKTATRQLTPGVLESYILDI
jgi:hypothetical protein